MLSIGYWSYGNKISDKIKQDFFQAVSGSSVLLYGCTIWTQMKCMERKLEGNTMMLWAVLK